MANKEPHMIHDELYRAKRIRACETELLKLYMTCRDPRAFSAITDVIDAALYEGAVSERYKDFWVEGKDS